MFNSQSLPPPNSFTLEEYFALERASERRFEYRDGEIVCMSGGSREHATIASNVIRNLGNKLPKTCRVYGSDLAAYVPDGPPYCAVCDTRSRNGRQVEFCRHLIVVEKPVDLLAYGSAPVRKRVQIDASTRTTYGARLLKQLCVNVESLLHTDELAISFHPEHQTVQWSKMIDHTEGQGDGVQTGNL